MGCGAQVEQATAVEAPTIDAPAEPQALTPAEVEEFGKKIEAEKAALWEKMKETGAWLKEGDLELLRAEREKWACAVLAAKKLENIPHWVQGPRPSDELLARGDPGDPFDKTPWKPIKGFAEIVLKGRLPNGACIHTYELPSSLKIEPVNANGVPCAWCNWPGTSASKGVILYFHGGGGMYCDFDPNRCARLSCLSGLRVLSVDYRLAPEHIAKVGVEDCVTAYRWLTETMPSDQVIVYGASYGGFLVMAFLQALLQQDRNLPACAVSESPTLPGFGNQQGIWELVGGMWNGGWNGPDPDANVSWEEILADPFYNVLEGQLKGLPPIYFSVGSLEHVENQINIFKALAEACTNAGVKVEHEVVRNLRHTPFDDVFMVPEATAYGARIVAFMHKCLAEDCIQE
jgi:acetyl esterase/lipase